MHIEAVTHIYMGIKENKSTEPWTRSNQSAIMAGLIIMCCFCLFKWRVSVSAILSWIRQWKTVACSFKHWMRAATSGSTVKHKDGLFRNQCQSFISKVNNLHILSNRWGSTRHERKLKERCGFPGVSMQQERFKAMDPQCNPLYGPLSFLGGNIDMSIKNVQHLAFCFFELVSVKRPELRKIQLAGSLTSRAKGLCPVLWWWMFSCREWWRVSLKDLVSADLNYHGQTTSASDVLVKNTLMKEMVSRTWRLYDIILKWNTL